MMRSIVPILLLIGAGLAFYLSIDPTYKEVQELKVEEAQFDKALDNSKELIAVRDELNNTYNSFRAEDLARIERLLPDHIDNVRLIMEIDGISSRHDMILQNVKLSFKRASTAEENGAVALESAGLREVNSAILRFSVNGTYETLLSFLTDLERSLRLIDVQSVSFSSAGEQHEYEIEIKTYWLN